MSLLFADLAYLGIKTVYNVGYYTFKYSYNGIAYLTGSEYMVDKKPIDTNELVLKELKELRKEIAVLKENNTKKEVVLEDFIEIDKNAQDVNKEKQAYEEIVL